MTGLGCGRLWKVLGHEQGVGWRSDETDRRRARQVGYNYLDLTSDDAIEALEFATQADLEVYIANMEFDVRESAKRSN